MNLSLEQQRALAIAAARKRQAESVDPSAGVSRAEAALIGIGSGFVRAGRGIKGLFGYLTGDDEIKQEIKKAAAEQRQAMQPLKERYPIATGGGEIIGETAGALPFGMGGAAAGLKLGARYASPTLSRFAAAGLGGASEGALIGAAEGQAGTGAAIGGGAGVALEAALPRLGRLFRKLKGRAITTNDVGTQDAIERLRADLQQSGAQPDEIAAALDDVSNLPDIPQGANAEQIATQAAFQQEGVPMATRSRLTRATDDYAREIQLSRQIDSGAADELRQRLFREDQAIEDRAREVASSFGVDQDVGVTIQTALNDLRSDFGTRRRAAYKELRDIVRENPEVADMVPMPIENVQRSLFNAQEILRANPTEQNALDQLMAQYGMIGDFVEEGPRFTEVLFFDETGEKVIDKIKYRGKPKEFNIGNAETFRQQINALLDPKDPRQAAARREILSGYDTALDEMVEEIPEAAPQNVIETAKKARGIAREEKVIFDPKRIIDKISKGNADGNPLMDASKVYDSVRRASNEDFNRMVKGLQRVESGEGAINNLKAAALIDFTEQATKTARKISDDRGVAKNIFSGTNFKKAINKFGRAKAKQLFGDDWSTILRLERIGESRIPTDAGVQKGSAPDLINQMIRTFSKLSERVPIAGQKVADIAQEEAAKRELRQVTDLSPTKDQIDDYIAFSAKRLASILGLSTVSAQQATEVQ